MSDVRSRATWRLLVGTAAVVALGGCADEPEEVARSSGPLADGFEIEPGSGLVGAVFPLGSMGHQVVLRADGDLPKVFEGYVRQAEELGYPLESGWSQRPEGQWCSDPDDGTDDDPDEGPFTIECTAYGSVPNEWQVSLRGLAETDGQGYLTLQVLPSIGDEEPSPPAPDGPVAPTTDDELVPELAVPEDDPPLRLVEGSELIGEPLPATCATGGFVAVLRVTGELMPVMRGYAEQIADMRAFDSDGLVGSEEEPSVGAYAAGGGDLGFIGAAGTPSYVLVNRCND